MTRVLAHWACVGGGRWASASRSTLRAQRRCDDGRHISVDEGLISMAQAR